MGEAFLTRRGSTGSAGGEITFDNTPMVAVKTLPNAIKYRSNMAVATNNEYLALAGGSDSSGTNVKDINVFDRSGRQWYNEHPSRLTEMAAAIVNEKLMTFGGVNANGFCTNATYKWAMGNLIGGGDSAVRMESLTRGKRSMSVGVLQDDVIALNGIDDAAIPWKEMEKYQPHSLNTSPIKAHEVLSINLSNVHAYGGVANLTERSIVTAGGYDVSNDSLINRVEAIIKNTEGGISLLNLANLSAPQYEPAIAVIHSLGVKYMLIGLGKKMSTQQGTMISDGIVPTIDVYYYDGISGTQCSTSKYKSFSLSLPGNPSSAIGLSFSNYALFVVFYRGSTKSRGYLVRLYPFEVRSMEFDFHRSGAQGAVIGNDVGYIFGGFKNGQVTGDVEMIKLIRNAPIYPGMKYKLGDMTDEETASSFTLYPLKAESHLSGYMKL